MHHSAQTFYGIPWINPSSHKWNSIEQIKRLLFSSVRTKSPYFPYELGSFNHGVSFWEWHLHHKLHTGSVMAPNFSLGQAVGGVGSLMLLGCTGNHIDYHSCFFWINLHHPLAIFSIIFHLGRQMMEMAVCMEPICGTAEIPSGDLALSPS